MQKIVLALMLVSGLVATANAGDWSTDGPPLPRLARMQNAPGPAGRRHLQPGRLCSGRCQHGSECEFRCNRQVRVGFASGLLRWFVDGYLLAPAITGITGVKAAAKPAAATARIVSADTATVDTVGADTVGAVVVGADVASADPPARLPPAAAIRLAGSVTIARCLAA